VDRTRPKRISARHNTPIECARALEWREAMTVGDSARKLSNRKRLVSSAASVRSLAMHYVRIGEFVSPAQSSRMMIEKAMEVP
jgi:hypothetical protein